MLDTRARPRAAILVSLGRCISRGGRGKCRSGFSALLFVGGGDALEAGFGGEEDSCCFISVVAPDTGDGDGREG